MILIMITIIIIIIMIIIIVIMIIIPSVYAAFHKRFAYEKLYRFNDKTMENSLIYILCFT